MGSFKVVLAYDGTDFVGWQRQASGTSIQSLVEDALGTLDGRDVAVAGAGRTDAGVHALGQVASFSLDRVIAPDTLARALNAQLPPDVRVLSAHETTPAFHARFDARGKTYRYRIWLGDALSPFERRYAWHVVGSIDEGQMAEAATLLDGAHDFAAFQSAGSATETTVRTIVSSRVRSGALLGLDLAGEEGRPKGAALLEYEVTGDGFLRHMVRAIVGTLVEIGRRRRPIEWMSEVLESRDRGAAGPTAPAQGLFLVSVDYGVRSLADEP